MSLGRLAFAAWWRSVLTCAVGSALFVVNAQAWTGRWSRMVHNLVDLTMAWTIVFAAVCATVIVPAFLILTRAGVGTGRRPIALTIGACLATTTPVAFAMAFRESGDPETVIALVRWLATHPGMLLQYALGSLPFLAAGLVFGWAWAAGAFRSDRDPLLP